MSLLHEAIWMGRKKTQESDFVGKSKPFLLYSRNNTTRAKYRFAFNCWYIFSKMPWPKITTNISYTLKCQVSHESFSDLSLFMLPINMDGPAWKSFRVVFNQKIFPGSLKQGPLYCIILHKNAQQKYRWNWNTKDYKGMKPLTFIVIKAKILSGNPRVPAR